MASIGETGVQGEYNLGYHPYAANGSQLLFTDSGTLFQPLGTLSILFDPHVIWDQQDNRFVVVCLERRGQSQTSSLNVSRILIAVSDNSDPNGLWRVTAIDAKDTYNNGTTNYDLWADFPGVGVDADAIYITANQARFSDNTTVRPKLWIVQKAALYGTVPTTPPTSFTSIAVNNVISNSYDIFARVGAQIPEVNPATQGPISLTVQPAHTFGTIGTGNGTFLVTNALQRSGYTGEDLLVMRVSSPLAAAGPTFTAQWIDLGGIINNYSVAPPTADQLGTTERIDAGDNRLLNAVWRNGRLYTCNTINPPAGLPDAGEATVHWYVVNTGGATWTLEDQGSVGGESIAANTNTFYPSIMVDAANNIGLGFSASGPNIYPGCYYTGRNASDPDGTTFAPGTVHAGEDFYVRKYGDAVGRWGDFSGISLSPTNEYDFWTFNEYATTRGLVFQNYPTEDGRYDTTFGSFAMRDFGIKNDYNGDGFPDLVVESGASTHFYMMNGATRLQDSPLTDSAGKAKLLPTSYAIGATGDFNRDGRSDLVLQYSSNLRIWQMNGTRYAAQLTITTPTGAIATNAAAVAASGDFDRDGSTDLVFQNKTTGAVSIWYLGFNANTGNYTVHTASANLSPQLTNYTTQRVVGAADYNGDGVPDLVVQNVTTGGAGQISVYFLGQGSPVNGNIGVLGVSTLNPSPATDRIVGADDMNGDGLPDLIFQNGAAIGFYPRVVPAGQTVQNSFTFGTRQQFVQNDGVTPLVTPSTTWVIRN